MTFHKQNIAKVGHVVCQSKSVNLSKHTPICWARIWRPGCLATRARPGQSQARAGGMRSCCLSLLLIVTIVLRGGRAVVRTNVDFPDAVSEVIQEVPHGVDLSVTLWRVFPDTAVFDWYITLEEKHRWYIYISLTLLFWMVHQPQPSKCQSNNFPVPRCFTCPVLSKQ